MIIDLLRMSTASSIRLRTNSLKTSTLRKIAPIFFIKILKGAAGLSINDLEDAAFLSNFGMSFFLLHRLGTFLWRDHHAVKVALIS